MLKEFDEKFSDKEGCQAYSSKCGKKDKNGKFICSCCAAWGGQQGVAKDWKKPTSSSKEIKQFITEQISKAIDEVIPEYKTNLITEKRRLRYSDVDYARNNCIDEIRANKDKFLNN